MLYIKQEMNFYKISEFKMKWFIYIYDSCMYVFIGLHFLFTFDRPGRNWCDLFIKNNQNISQK